MKKRVVVTGVGTVSCFGMDPEVFYQSLMEGKSGVRFIDSFDVSAYPTKFAAPIVNFDTEGYLDKKQSRRVDPFISYAIVAGKKALEYAGFSLNDLSSLDKAKCGVIVGSGMGGMKMFGECADIIHAKGYKRLTPFFIPYIITNMASGLLSMEIGFEGPNYSISTACATANNSIISAMNHIRRGEADLMICGGTEAAINDIGLSGFLACRALSEREGDPTKASRPWDKGREGFVMGEGAAVLVIESLEHAKKRGAKILAELAGGFCNADAYHLTDPRPDGSAVARCMDLAIKDADLEVSKINYVNAHATSTLVGDLCEVRAIKQVMGDHGKNVWINATKSMIGHCLGAAGGMEAVATVLSIRDSMIHPTLNLDDPEDELAGINVTRDKAQPLRITGALSNSFGFGGHNAILVFTPYNGN